MTVPLSQPVWSFELEHKSDVLETFITENRGKNIKENLLVKKKAFEKAIHIMKRLLKCFKNSRC